MEAEDALLEVSERDFIFLNSDRKKVKIILRDILYIESLKEYIHIHTKTETFTFKMPISKIEEKSANIIQIYGKKLPVGRTYKPLIEL